MLLPAGAWEIAYNTINSIVDNVVYKGNIRLSRDKLTLSSITLLS